MGTHGGALERVAGWKRRVADLPARATAVTTLQGCKHHRAMWSSHSHGRQQTLTQLGLTGHESSRQQQGRQPVRQPGNPLHHSDRGFALCHALASCPHAGDDRRLDILVAVNTVRMFYWATGVANPRAVALIPETEVDAAAAAAEWADIAGAAAAEALLAPEDVWPIPLDRLPGCAKPVG